MNRNDNSKKSAAAGQVSPAVIRRLPRYHRFLGELLRRGIMRTNSTELSAQLGVTASQIRQDLNCFGGFGQQGYGYNVRYLYERIGELLGVNEGFSVIIVGAGNLGRALVSSHMFERRGVSRLAMFDVSPDVIGKEISGVRVYNVEELEEYCKTHHVDIAVLTTPKDVSHEVALRIAACGIGGIWNFSNNELTLPDYPDTIIENIHLGDSLLALCYALRAERAEHDPT